MSLNVQHTVANTAAAGRSPERRGRRRPAHSFRSRTAPIWLLSPAGLVIAALILAPIAFLVYTSFTDYNQRTLFTGEYSGTGLQQYTTTIIDPQFWHSLVLTILFTAAMVLGSVIIGAGVAQMMTKVGSILRYALVVVLIFAWAMPTVASSQVWDFLFTPSYGVVNWLLDQLGIFGDTSNLAWTNSALLGLTCIWLLVVWQAVPFIALTTYAAQSQIDKSYLEAARIDGASETRIYFGIILSMLRPTLLLIVVLSIIWDFNVFNQIWLVTQGGPNNGTATLGIWTYLKAFNNFQIGTGAAISVITTIILLIVTGFYIRSLLKAGEEL